MHMQHIICSVFCCCIHPYRCKFVWGHQQSHHKTTGWYYIVTDDLIQLTIDFFFILNSTTVATSLAGTQYPGPCLHEHFSPIQFPASPANFKLSNCAQTKLQQLSLLSQELRFISILLKNNPASNSPIKYKSLQIYY